MLLTQLTLLFQEIDQLSTETKSRDEDTEEFSSFIHSELTLKPETIDSLRQLKQDLEAAFKEAGARKWDHAVDRIWAFGPRGNGPNILLNQDSDYNRFSMWTSIEVQENPSLLRESLGTYRDFDHALVSGFQLAVVSGPLCEEPVHGVCFVVEKWELNLIEECVVSKCEDNEQSQSNNRPSIEKLSQSLKNVKFADLETSSDHSSVR